MCRGSLVLLALLLVVPLTSTSTAVATERGVASRGTRAGSRPSADGLTRALRTGRIDRATYTLERARALFDLGGVRARYGDVAAADGREATMVLRDLFRAYEDLTPAERGIADALLARPTDGQADDFGDGYTAAEATPYCSTDGCLHYVATTVDAPPITDANANSVPDWVETTATEFQTVWAAEITDLGFRAPKSDITSSNNGGDGRIDIYLAQTGDDGFYGYCASDDPADFFGSYRYFDASVFCVIDNDFAELGGLAALRATLAHEFFHGVQAAYDWFEDRWFMESTATWMEEQVFDDIDDNVQYLGSGALGKPWVPLDSNNAKAGVYGNWIFHQFISETFAVGAAGDVDVVREAWERADGSREGPDQYSTQAIANALKATHGVRFRRFFADFAMYNDAPEAFYEEAEANAYPAPPLADTLKVTKRNGGGGGSVQLDHLTSAYIALVPGRGVSGDSSLRISVNLGARRTGPGASAVVAFTSGEVEYHRFSIDRSGDGRIRVPFGSGTVASVDLVLTNASLRTRCWTDQRGRYACWGEPMDDDVRGSFRAVLLN